MKKYLKVVVTTAVILGLLGGVSYAGSSVFTTSSSTAKSDPRSITVNGEGVVKVKPDIAYIDIGVNTEDAVAKVAQQKNAEIMDKVMKKFEELGIDKNDIKTVNYNMYPKYQYVQKTGKSIIDGYTVTNTVEITVKDITKTGSVIDAATEAGANISNDIRFSISDTNKYYNEALKKAVEAGKGKAETIASVIGVGITAPYSVTENSTGGQQVVYQTAGIRAKAMDEAAAPTTPVAQGELEVKANVSLVYRY